MRHNLLRSLLILPIVFFFFGGFAYASLPSPTGGEDTAIDRRPNSPIGSSSLTLGTDGRSNRSLLSPTLRVAAHAPAPAIAVGAVVLAPGHALAPAWKPLDLLQVEQVTRFNYMDRAPHTVTDRDIQYRLRIRARINLTHSQSTSLQARAETGKGFDNSWNDTGLGKGPGLWNFNVKTFFVEQKIAQFLRLQAGGLEFDQGSGSQRTYASGDSSFVGYRAEVKDTTRLLRSGRLVLTSGYIGDFDRPNVFSRLSLGRVNYRQILVQKIVSASSDASFAVDSIQNIPYLRPAWHYRKLGHPVLDDVMVEAVARVDATPHLGWSATIARPLNSTGNWRGSIVYSDIPPELYRKNGKAILFNQGEIDTGKRISWGTDYAPAKRLNLGLFAGRLLDAAASKRWVAQVSVSYQYASLFNRMIR